MLAHNPYPTPDSLPYPYIFLHSTKRAGYTADAHTIRCYDDDFWKAFKKFLRVRGINRPDPCSWAGGIKAFASPRYPEYREFALESLDISVERHGAKLIMLFAHHDCAAYGGFGTFGNDHAQELAYLQNELRVAREVVLQRNSNLEVEMYFIDCKGVILVE